MLYLSDSDLLELGVDWRAAIACIERAARIVLAGDYAQPLKPYLRYREPRNRIIAMPAFLGGDVDTAGIKWIASFPGNVDLGIPRAHSVIVLNESSTGRPRAIVNTPRLSVVRTTAVSGLFLERWRRARPSRPLTVGITGWGPIGRQHAKMAIELLGDDMGSLRIFDVRPHANDALEGLPACDVQLVSKWEDAYDDADVFITCTVSSAPYIDRAPKRGSLHLNVSLRDYCTSFFDHARGGIVVDDWEEVCRERTDIEMMHLERGLQREMTRSLFDIVEKPDWLGDLERDIVMFNPMGMAIFDIAIAEYYTRLAREHRVGLDLP